MIPELKKILCPLDLTTQSEASLAQAIALARRFQTKLIVCFCASPTSRSTSAETRRRLDALVENVLGRLVAREAGKAEIEWESVVVENEDAALGIIGAAEQFGVELIAMCSSPHPWLHTLLGSVAEAVARDAPCPVLVFTSFKKNEQNTGPLFRRILVAHDFSDYSELALQNALVFAGKYGADLHLLHVIVEPVRYEPELAWSEHAVNHLYHQTNERLQRALPRETSNFHGVVTAVRWGRPYREILAYAKEYEIDLVAMGAHGTDFGQSTLFGSNIDRVLRQMSGAVLIARPLKPLVKGTERGSGPARKRPVKYRKNESPSGAVKKILRKFSHPGA
jgi:nucleotide-binding universal stress UspA family protein